MHRVLISDPSKDALDEMDYFITGSELDLTNLESTDVSDVSTTTDELYSYCFSNEKDALIFAIRFGGTLCGGN